MKDGILTESDRPVIFLYEQVFHLRGTNFKRRALVGRVRIEDFEKRVILPHEKTLSAPKEDRYKLIKTTNLQSEPIFGIVIDDGNVKDISDSYAPQNSELLFEFTDENDVKHRLYLVDEKIYPSIEEAFENKKILIADGHHRYETALRIKKEFEKSENYQEDAPYNYILMCVVSSLDSGLIVQPIYRVVKIDNEKLDKLSGYITGETDVKDIKKLDYSELSKNEFIFVKKDRAIRIKLDNINNGRTSVEILHEEIINKIFGIGEEDIAERQVIRYFKNVKEGFDNLREDEVLIIYNPPKPEEISKISEKGKTLPQKSTYFYPKFYSGLFMYPLW